jgi:DNA primase
LTYDVHSEILDIAYKFLENVRPSGSENVMALCPFHDDATASFAMNILNGVYFCHSCHAKGNLLTFLRGVGVSHQLIDLQYKDLIEAARRTTPPGPDPLDPGVYSLAPLPEGALGFFDGYTIPSLLMAGFKEETLRYFDVGFDHWHDRITYPIRDTLGRLVGINGRTLHKDVRPRYKIYNKEYLLWGLPERGPWDRRKVLYNLHNVLPSLLVHRPEHSFLVVVEGYKACMWVWQAGIKNVIGLMGSYFSWEHRWLIEKFGGKVYFFLDNNAAGIRGTYNAGQVLQQTKRYAVDPYQIRFHQDPGEELMRAYRRYDGPSLGSTLNAHVIEYPPRLLDDEDAQPDNLTAEEVWEQLFDAVPYSTWLNEKEGTVPVSNA